MFTTTKQDETTSLQQSLEDITKLQKRLHDGIRKLESGSEINVINHICISNLKSKLERLDEIKKILSIEKYKIVFIGTIGQGKTTAICHLFNLISDFKVSKTIGGKTRDVIETKELLATGSGRTTICEVVLKASEKTYIEIEPYSVEEMESLIFEFCESIPNKDSFDSEHQVMISAEIERAIRNITDLRISSQTVFDGDKKNTIRIDAAKVLFEEIGLEGMKKTALNNANLESRTSIKIEFDNETKEQQWIKNNFTAINNAQLKDFAIPRKIYLHLSNDVLSGSNLSQFDFVVDTKGLDENPIRQDLHKYIDSKDTICLFVTPFTAAPETNITELMRYHLKSKSKQFHHRFVTLVLPRKNEPEKANGCDGNWDLGVQIKKEEIQSTFKKLNLALLQENILFYDSLRYYRHDIVKVNNDFYTQEDVQADKNELIAAIAGVIERRKKYLLDEIDIIQDSFEKIQSGDALTEVEIKAIEKAIQKIEVLRDLGKELHSSVYESEEKEKHKPFIEQYIEYYNDKYKVWSTKHAIHRRFGHYEEKNIDIYYDAKVVAEKIRENETLNKFSIGVQKELKNILDNLASENKSLNTLIPELIKEFDVLYDKFIHDVGIEIQEELKIKLLSPEELTKELSPQSEKSEFWKALLAEKGRKRDKGEKYADNVCQIFRQEMESEPNLNKTLQKTAEYHWEQLVTKILSFFGQ